MVGDSPPSSGPKPVAEQVLAPPTSGPGLTSFTCPACGAAVALRAAGLTLTAICSACGSVCDSDNGEFKLVKKFDEAMRIKPAIALGIKGKIRGQTYQVIGFMQRYAKGYAELPWEEYLLYNPYTGYGWLVQNRGHWNFFKATKNVPQDLGQNKFSFLGDTYSTFDRGIAIVNFVIGEFYWRVRVGHSVETLDAICPPHLLSCERDQAEVVWSIGEYLEPAEVVSAFHPHPMPEREGIAPNQPGYGKGISEMVSIFFVAVFLFLILQLVQQAAGHQNLASQVITADHGPVTDADIGQFSVETLPSHVSINVFANLEQSWATVDLRVVSDDGSQAVAATFTKDFSFYSGYEEGERWSEGARSSDFLINHLKKGHYRVFLSVTPETGRYVQVTSQITVAPAVWANFWLAVFLILLPPLWLVLRSRAIERRRWSESDYSPFEGPFDGSSGESRYGN